MKEVTFITGNENKVAQLSRHFSIPIDHKRLDLSEVQSADVCEVSTQKALVAYQKLKKPVLVEDTALTFNAYGNLPGPFVKWFLEAPGVGNVGMVKMLAEFDDKSAFAEVCFAICDEQGVQLFYGRVEGSISPVAIGTKGFGWDPIFIPAGQDQTFAQMSKQQQHETSMRKIALEKLGEYLLS